MPTKSKKFVKPGAKSVDLARLFSAVSSNLAGNREQLNNADALNGNHGDNMVNIFQTIAKTIQQYQDVDQSRQLASASRALTGMKSGSARLYSDGLTRASERFKGQTITPENIGTLLQSLMGAQTTISPTQISPSIGESLGPLLESLAGAQTGGAQAGTGTLDLGDILNAGMTFLDAKQKGSSTLEALIGALVTNSPLGQTSHRSQSGTLVANAIMQYLASLKK